MKVYVPIKKIVIAENKKEANRYLAEGAILIDTLIERIVNDDHSFRDFAEYVIGLTDACEQ